MSARAGEWTSETRTEERLLWTVNEFCEVCRISRATLYKLWETGEGPPRVKVRRATRIPRAGALRWVERKAGEAR